MSISCPEMMHNKFWLWMTIPYDAGTSIRVYKDALTYIDAVSTISNASGQQFDSDVVEAFLFCRQQFKERAEELADDWGTEESRDKSRLTSVDVVGLHSN